MLFHELNNKFKIILASKSPRRQEILRMIGLEFQVKTAHVDEIYPDNLKPEQIPEYLSKMKADALRSAHVMQPDELIISADTIVVMDGVVYEKPKDAKHAFEMLNSLSGKSHDVITGVTMLSLHKAKSFSESTRVRFKELSNSEIRYYIENYEPFDKAGSYAIQEWIGMIGIEKIEGDYLNIVGFPANRIYTEIKSF